MASNRGLRVRDPIHGLIPYDGTEEAVINSRPLQRLRGVRQLALACLGYPGALHTRFDHTLGVMHVAGRMMKTLQPFLKDLGIADDAEFERQRRLVRLAALVHDVGHGPYSHVSEHVLDHVSGGAAAKTGVGQAKLHEQVTLAIVEHDKDLGRILSEDDRRGIREILDTNGAKYRSVYRDIVSGSLDADKLDYLLRDAYFAGVRYGVFDLERILDEVRVINDPPGNQLAVGDDAVPLLEQLYVARYHMTLQVYRHKTRRVTDAMLQLACMLAAEQVPAVKALYAFPVNGNPDKLAKYVERFLGWDDRRLMDCICDQTKCPQAGELMEALRSRSLPKELFKMDIDDMRLDAPQANRLEVQRDAVLGKLEEWVADTLNLERDFVFADLQDVQAKTGAAPGRALDPEEILVVVDGLGSYKLTDRSAVFEKARLEPKSYLSIFVREPEFNGEDDRATWEQSARRQILKHLKEEL